MSKYFSDSSSLQTHCPRCKSTFTIHQLVKHASDQNKKEMICPNCDKHNFGRIN